MYSGTKEPPAGTVQPSRRFRFFGLETLDDPFRVRDSRPRGASAPLRTAPGTSTGPIPLTTSGPRPIRDSRAGSIPGGRTRGRPRTRPPGSRRPPASSRDSRTARRGAERSRRADRPPLDRDVEHHAGVLDVRPDVERGPRSQPSSRRGRRRAGRPDRDGHPESERELLERHPEPLDATPASRRSRCRSAGSRKRTRHPMQAFPADAQASQSDLRAVCQILQSKYPNIRICYLSSRIYAGYATTSLNPEPFAYQSGFAVKWLIESQIARRPRPQLRRGDRRRHVAVARVGSVPLGRRPRPAQRRADVGVQRAQPDGTHPDVLGALQGRRACSTSSSTRTRPPRRGTPSLCRIAVRAVDLSLRRSLSRDERAAASPCSGPPVLGSPIFGDRRVARRGRTRVAMRLREPRYADVVGERAVPRLRRSRSARSSRTPSRRPRSRRDAGGSGRGRPSIPNDPSLMGLSAYAQILVADPAGAAFPQFGGAALTRAVRLILGTP